MEGYNVNGASVYRKQGSALKAEELQAVICFLCGFILRGAMQVTQCGHRYCKNCIEKVMSDTGDYKCPVDNEPFEKAEVRRDRGCQKEVDSLEVDCPTNPNPCKWRGALVEIEVHRVQCPHALVSCTLKCGYNLRRDELSNHVRNDCTKRHVTCTHCQGNYPWDGLESHFLECPEYPIACDHCQLQLASRKLMQSHLDNECSNYQRKCPMQCSDFLGNRTGLMEHLKSHSLDIVQLLLTTVARVEVLETRQQQSDKTISTLTEKLENALKEKNFMQTKITELEQNHTRSIRNEEIGDELHALVKVDKYDDVTVSNDKMHSRPKSLLPLNAHVKGIAQNSIASEGGMEVVRENAGSNHMKQEIESHGTQILKISETLQTVQSHLTQYTVAIDEVRLRQDILDVKVTNGLLIWRIPDIRRRYRDAIERRTISLYSPPFYTSPHGYRMCIRTYLNGDGIGKGTHISLFFVIMRSEQDNLLPWPFKQSVRFTLVNQKNPAMSITEAFVPNQKSPSFLKPENDMNVASGFPKFARQSTLQDENFTLGDMIFIKCHIDVAGLNIE